MKMPVKAGLRMALGSSVAIAGLVLGGAPGNATGRGAIELGASRPLVVVDQGPDWTPATRTQFYSQDQGSQIMPLAWFRALRQPNGRPFLRGSLSRYGYLPNPASPTPGLPVGFTVNGAGRSDRMVG